MTWVADLQIPGLVTFADSCSHVLFNVNLRIFASALQCILSWLTGCGLRCQCTLSSTPVGRDCFFLVCVACVDWWQLNMLLAYRLMNAGLCDSLCLWGEVSCWLRACARAGAVPSDRRNKWAGDKHENTCACSVHESVAGRFMAGVARAEPSVQMRSWNIFAKNLVVDGSLFLCL
jgi:hypothetical protein